VAVKWVYALAILTLPTLFTRRALAVDPFEIQVYDGTAQNPGAFALELHANASRDLHFTLEPQYGLFSWWEVGGYFQTAVVDGSFDYAGVKFRSKWVTPPKWSQRWRFGVNMEVGILPTSFDKNEWGLEVRPMAAFENDRFVFVVNPIVDVAGRPPGGNPDPKHPTFEPAAMALVKWNERVSVGLEYYANLGPLSGFVPIEQQEHYVYEVVNILAIKNVELNLGIGEGLTPASNRFVAKMILGYTWERRCSQCR
jgi:hypothetical protein